MQSLILKQALGYIAHPAGWCTGARARDAAGREVPVMDAAAVQFCSKGALYRAVGSETADISGLERFFTMKENKGNPLGLNYVGFNELKPYTAVMVMWQEAIRLAEQEEARAGAASVNEQRNKAFAC